MEPLWREVRPLPYLNGVYVAMDAVPRSFLIVDGPYCIPTKASMQMSHNLRSDLIRPWGRSRIVLTGTQTRIDEMAVVTLNRTQSVEKQLREVSSWDEPDVILVTAFEFHQLLNMPLDRMVRSIADETGRPLVFLPPRSLSSDWLEGYAAVCTELARWIPLNPQRRETGSVAIVGHMMDRTEGDQTANVCEIERLVTALGLKCTSLWLSGRGIDHLREIDRAEVIVSLPYAREAARTMSRRLGVAIVECDIPLGLGNIAAFLRVLAGSFGLKERAEEIIDREEKSAVRDVEGHLARILAGKKAALYLADPHLVSAMNGFCSEIGMEAVGCDSRPEVSDCAGDCIEHPLEGIDLCVTSTLGTSPPPKARVPFGYPNYLDHPISPRPFLGYTGFRNLVERLSNVMLRVEAGPGW